MDVVSAAASVIAVVTAGIQTIQVLSGTIESIKNVSNDFDSVSVDLKALSPVLSRLKNAVDQRKGTTALDYDSVIPPIKTCQTACETFDKRLKKWFKDTNQTGKVRVLDKAKMVMLRPESLKLFRSQIAECKATLTLVLVINGFIVEDARAQTLLGEINATTRSSQQYWAAIETVHVDPQDEAAKRVLLEQMKRQRDANKDLTRRCTEVIHQAAGSGSELVNEEIVKLGEHLWFTNPKEDRELIIDTAGARAEGTLEWVFEKDVFKGWMAGNPSFLWITGEPGKGKTTLAVYLSSELQTRIKAQDAQVIYYFCRKEDDRRNTASAVLRGLLWQLAVYSKRSQCIARHLAEHGRPILSENDQLWRLFAAIMLDNNMGTVYCVLDGLDELEDEDHTWLAKKLRSLFFANESDLNVLRLVLLSRNLPDFKMRSSIKRLDLDTDASTEVESDLAHLIWSRLQQVPNWEGFRPDYQAQVHNEFLRKANGSFLSVDYVMRKILVDKPFSGIFETIESLPVGPEAMLKDAIQSVKDQQQTEAPEILCWVALAVRPLSLLELADAVGERVNGHSTLDEAAILATAQRCGALLTIHDNIVTFTHASMRDFLLRGEQETPHSLEQVVSGPDGVLDRLRIDARKAHMRIADKCLQLIKESHLKHKILDSPDDWVGAPLLKYAVLYWPHHARSSGDVGKEIFQSTSFIQPNLTQNWWRTYVDQQKGEEWEQGERLSPLHIACRFGIVEWVRTLLVETNETNKATLKKIIDECDVSGVTPLAWAAIGGHDEVLRLLLDHGADINKETALYSQERGSSLMSTYAMMSALSYVREASKGDSMWTGHHFVLYRAAYKGRTAAVKVLLERGADVHALGWADATAMHGCAIGGNLDVAELLIEKGGDKDVNATLKGSHTTPLHYAVENGNLEVVRLLLDHGAKITQRQNGSLATVLHFAGVKSPHPETVKLLIERGADVHVHDSHHRRPLHCFVMKHADPRAVKLLLDADHKINCLNSLRRTPLDISIDCMCTNCQDNVKLLLVHGGKLKNPRVGGRKNHPELFKEVSGEPRDTVQTPSLLSSDDGSPMPSPPLGTGQGSLGSFSGAHDSLMETISNASPPISGPKLVSEDGSSEMVDGEEENTDQPRVRKRDKFKAAVRGLFG